METLISMFIYIIIYTITLGISKIANYIRGKNKLKVCMFFTALIPSILSGVRFETGRDYESYINNFDRIVAGYDSRLEIGFQYLCKGISWIGLPAQFMLFASALIMMLFICKSLYRKKDIIPIGIGLLTFLFIFYQSSYNVIRLMLAVPISLYNIKNIENKKLFRFIILTLIASSFHITAFVMFPMYFVYNYFIHQNALWKKILLYIIVIFVIIKFNVITQELINKIQVDNLDYYTKYIADDGLLSMDALRQSIFYVPLIIIGLFNYKKCRDIDKSFDIYFSLTIIGTIIIVISIFLQNYVNRLAEYFLIYNVFVIPTYYKAFKIKRSYLAGLFLISFIILFWAYWYFLNGAHGTYHYNWIFE